MPVLNHAQTGLISHKSHSGKATSYSMSTFGNFGARIEDLKDIQPSQALLNLPVLREVKKVNDSIVILTQDYSNRIQYDTIYNHPLFGDPNMTVDSLKKLYFNDVEFTNFEEKISENEQQKSSAIPKEQETTKAVSKKQQRKEKRDKSWMILFLIGGGTFLGVGRITTYIKRRKLIELRLKHSS